MSFPVFALLLLQQNPDERFVFDGVVQGGSVSDDGIVTRHCRFVNRPPAYVDGVTIRLFICIRKRYHCRQAENLL